MLQSLRRSLDRLATTPLHPQWFALRREQHDLQAICEGMSGLVLDVGCASGKPRRLLSAEATYVGLDYYQTAKNWYQTRPELYGDARRLPLQATSINHILLLDVLEHISDPDQCLGELFRCLAPGGTLTVWVPFMYPVHDAPLDFHRWTSHGLKRAADRHGFEVVSTRACGHLLETAALLTNLALTKTVLNWAKAGNPLCLLGIVLPVLVPVINISSWVLGKLTRPDEMMPYAFQTVWRKPSNSGHIEPGESHAL